jgi:protein-disulfide isomerase
MRATLMKIPRAMLLAAAALAAFGCNKDKSDKASPPPATAVQPGNPGDPPPDTVVATVNGEKVTAGELDKHMMVELTAMEEKYHKDRFDKRRQGLEQMILERLVKAEAQKRGMNEDQFLKSEVSDKVPPPSDEKIKEVWTANQSQLPPGSTLEQFKDRIVEHLTEQDRRERARTFFDDLKKQAAVKILLTEPRKTVDAKGPSRGPNDAKVTIVEFSDFQCPFCGRAHDTVEEVMKAYAGKVRLVFRNFPLEFHPYAAKAAEAAMCANDQQKFWEYYDVLFANQQKLELPQLKEHAGAVGLDVGKFSECLDSGKQTVAVREDQAAGARVGVNGTPAFFINGVMLSGAQSLDEFKRVIDQELAN